MAAKVQNPRKAFQFQVVIPGLNPFLAQEVDSPDIDFDVVEHGDTNFDVKTAGRKKIGSCKISKIVPSDTIDRFVWTWKNLIQNTRTGGGALPSLYKRNVVIIQLAPDGILPLQTWELEGCWPQKINGISFSRKSSENTVETIELSVDEENS